ncbi:MAG: hypothetical protein F9K29_03260 [Hyphomicrobiaceae bacterium]|nr:MAG: hypothetical protein F9K29_03260 [Hyphomicrobiaceae bacterium]
MLLLPLFFLGSSGAQAEDEDHRLVCPIMSAELVKKVAAQIKGSGQCQTVCRGCGCKGGPGYRAPGGKCVGFAELISRCGPPPHAGCARECAPVHKSCVGHVLGRAWLKPFAASIGLTVSFQPAAAPEADTSTMK